MIDHVSLAVHDLKTSTAFYAAVLAPLGMTLIAERPGRTGFGSNYPELWLNERRDMTLIAADTGAHLCLRTKTVASVDAFHRIALASGGTDDGAPGPRKATMVTYYAAFIKDPDGNRIEVMTVPPQSTQVI